jgi:hypothetical protein
VSAERGGRPSARAVGCLFERSRTHALVALGADMHVLDSVVRDTTPREIDGLAGDGILFSFWDAPANGSVVGTTIAGNARVGIGSFGASVSTSSVHLDCNAIDLNGELKDEQPYEFVDQGGNQCGCQGNSWACQVASATIAPPEPLD